MKYYLKHESTTHVRQQQRSKANQGKRQRRLSAPTTPMTSGQQNAKQDPR
jgi:hypothetical protein